VINIKDAAARRISPLNTPNDFKPNAVRDISGALNILLADVFALYMKTKNFHWHMSGRISATITFSSTNKPISFS
jgi:starvation-inducible DNA-binding protein